MLFIEYASLVNQFPYPCLFALLVLGSVGLPVPEEATLLLCGVLISKNIIEPVPAFLVVYTGALASDFIIFYIGKKYGRKLISHRLFHRINQPGKLFAAEEKFRRFGPFIILLGRQITGFRAKLFFVAGMMGLCPDKFILLDAVAALFTVGVMVTVGYTGVKWFIWPKFEGIGIGYILAALAAILATSLLLYKRSRIKRDKNHTGDYLQIEA